MKQTWQIERYTSVGSTQDIAKAHARAGHPGWLAIVADEQTAGRGRMGRAWVAPPRANVLVSLVLRPDVPAEHAFTLTMRAGVALCYAVEQVASVTAALKWPNDLLVQQGGVWRKAAGILTESDIVQGRINWAVIGIGVNVGWHPTEIVDGKDLAQSTTCLDTVAGHTVNREALLDALLAHISTLDTPRDSLFSTWRTRLATLGQHVRVDTPGGAISGTAVDVAPSGALLVQDAAGVVQTVTAGDVQA